MKKHKSEGINGICSSEKSTDSISKCAGDMLKIIEMQLTKFLQLHLFDYTLSLPNIPLIFISKVVCIFASLAGSTLLDISDNGGVGSYRHNYTFKWIILHVLTRI